MRPWWVSPTCTQLGAHAILWSYGNVLDRETEDLNRAATWRETEKRIDAVAEHLRREGPPRAWSVWDSVVDSIAAPGRSAFERGVAAHQKLAWHYQALAESVVDVPRPTFALALRGFNPDASASFNTDATASTRQKEATQWP